MNQPVNAQRLVENEVMFRQYNEQVQQDMKALKQIATEDNQMHLVPEPSGELHFYCECSDENCRQRVLLSAGRYEEIHRARDQFVMVCGHEVDGIEDIVGQEDGYCIARKRIKPPRKASHLNPTPINNI